MHLDGRIQTYNNFRIAVPADYENVFSHFYFAENQSNEKDNKNLITFLPNHFDFQFRNKNITQFQSKYTNRN